jgi:hypothetical protein
VTARDHNAPILLLGECNVTSAIASLRDKFSLRCGWLQSIEYETVQIGVLVHVVTVGNEVGNSKLIHNFHTYTQMCRSLYSRKVEYPIVCYLHARHFRQAIFKFNYQLLAWALQYIGCNLTWGCSQTVCFCLLCILREFCEGFLTFLFNTHTFTSILFRTEMFHSTLT